MANATTLSKTFRVNPNDPRNVFGSRSLALAVLNEHGICCWVRACGTRAVMMWREGTRKRERTLRFSRLVFSEQVKA